MKSRYLFLILALALPLSAAEKTVLRVGYFPNITHAQGLVGSQSTREGKGWFDERLGSDVTVQWFPYNAGPSAMEALLAFKRAGADGVLTYFALDAASWLRESR